MLIAPPFGLLAHGLAVSKDLSAFADRIILTDFFHFVKQIQQKIKAFF